MKKVLTEVGLLIIGDEILSGRRNDKHFDYGIKYFSNLGIGIKWGYYIADEQPSLVHHFKMISATQDVCFSFGGIGATPDDLTRQSIAEAHDLEMVRHPEAVKLIEGKFGAEAYPNRIKMAELPKGVDLIPNDYNDIPGFSVGDIHCLPGFSEMARPMMDWVVRNRYIKPNTSEQFFFSFIVSDIHESQLVPVLEVLQNEYPEVKLSSLPRFPVDGKRQIELGAKGEKGQVVVVIEMLKEKLRGIGGVDFLAGRKD